ncbi:hypothetical protein BD311DRAFT_744059 [Dichomitus squalens]|uniref:Uncharacterized protein n=1 Tax=Dichomitus squalens TaxID=114155 RepID=A0A4Q9N4D6_9APHY|nr:hypothetical protein BD311DRAFT_744059 [Dichomitus squalens]
MERDYPGEPRSDDIAPSRPEQEHCTRPQKGNTDRERLIPIPLEVTPPSASRSCPEHPRNV